MIFMSETGETNSYDEVLVPHVGRYIRTCGVRNRIGFVHLQGSHIDPADRYPSLYERFSSDDHGKTSVDDYDNSVLYTDMICELVICDLEKLGKPACLIYLSDHGETPTAKGWRVVSDRDLWDVPFFVWTSKEYRLTYKDRYKRMVAARKLPLQIDQLLDGILHIFGVTYVGVRRDDDFLFAEFKPRNQRMIMGGKRKYMWDKK